MYNSQAEQVNRLLLDFLGVGWGSHHRSPVLSNELSSVPDGKIAQGIKMAHRRGQYQEMSYAGRVRAVPRLAILELVIRDSAISLIQSSPTASGKGSRVRFSSGRMEVSRDSSERQRPPMPHRAPGSTPGLFWLLLVFGLSLLFHLLSVSSCNHNFALLTSPQWSSPFIRKGSHRGISMECSQ